MHTTRLFKHGNSQALHIPAELAYAVHDAKVEIERVGDELRIRPVRVKPLTGLLEVFASFPADFLEEGRGEHTQAERDAL